MLNGSDDIKAFQNSALGTSIFGLRIDENERINVSSLFYIETSNESMNLFYNKARLIYLVRKK